MKSLLVLQQMVLQDMGDWCHTSTIRDGKTVADRFEHEGFAFLAITLPNFCRDFERALDRGCSGHDLWTSFKFRGGLPRFLGGFLDLVFDRGTGLLLREPSILAIQSVRQFCLLNKKVQRPCSNVRTQRAMRGYVEIDGEVKQCDDDRPDETNRQFRLMSLLLWGNVFEGVEFDVQRGALFPKHGPGATADRLKGNRKFDQSEWTERLEGILPSGEFLLPNWRHFTRLSHIDYRPPGRERPVMVTPVPKTLDKPRIIAVEPTCMQFMQQALGESIRVRVARNDTSSLFVDVLDQTPNQQLARKGSIDLDLATLDLSEASDRVSNSLVRELLAFWPQMSEAVQASRSLNANVPGVGVIPLSKFASMGSALCFPIEMMVFLTIIFLGVQDEHSKPLTKRGIRSLKGQVRVYGDDIIVPVQYVSSVIRRLESFGLRVNANKSFWTGKFRESCGKEYYAGVDVSVVRCKSTIPSSLMRENNSALISTVAMRNRMYHAGLVRAVKWLDSRITRLIPFPMVLPTSSVLGRNSVEGFESQRQSKRYHAPLVKGYVVAPVIPTSNLGGIGALLKCLSKQGVEPFADAKHLERAGRPVAVDIKLRWASPR